MKHIVSAVLFSLVTMPAFADGDASKGEKAFNKCKSCHTIATDAGDVIVKGGKTGPNLYGVIGRTVGSGDFKYSSALIAMGEKGMVWDKESVIAFIADPKSYSEEHGGGRSKMSFKLKKGGEDIVAYLESVAE
jgi:cytochrome c